MNTEHDPLDIHGQERDSAKAAEKERLLRERELSDLCSVMGRKEGRRFIWRQLSEAGVYRLSFDTDAAQMAFNEGSRNRGLVLIAELMEACPDRYSEMLKEQKELKEKDEQRTADRRNQRTS